MKLSVEWLKDWIALEGDVDDVAARLTEIGLTVDAVERPGEAIAEVRVARVEAVDAHPDADRLSVCTVHDGSDRHQVVCGAPNVRAGGLYPFAPAGTVLPGGLKLKVVKIRGVKSHGMLCSGKELGISDDHEGIMELDADAAVGTPLAQHLGLDDVVLELDVPYNRPDWLAVRGVARELGAMLGQPLTGTEIEPLESGAPAADAVTVSIEDPSDCAFYAARVVRGVRVGPSPDWLRRRLEAVGQRSINNVVDATNYILHTWSQPIHAFDLARVRGGAIRVRRASAGETLTTLDDQERKLTPEVLVIADAEGSTALAGVMGGAHSEVSETSVDLLLESALFDAARVRDGARGLGMDTDASTRFARGVDPRTVVAALDHTARLIAECAGGQVAPGVVSAGEATSPDRSIILRHDRISRVLGQPLDPPMVTTILERLGFDPRPEGEGQLRCSVPSWRSFDVEREIDLIEELARSHGYDQFEERQYNRSAVPARREPVDQWITRSAGVLVGLGFQEALTHVLTSEETARTSMGWAWESGEPVQLINALSRDGSVLRSSLIPGLLDVARHNLNRGRESLRIFEHGKVFRMAGGDGDGDRAERHELAGVLAGPRESASWQGPALENDLFSLKALLQAWYRRLGLPEPGASVLEGSAEPFHRGTSFALGADDAPRLRAGLIDPALAARLDVPSSLWLFSVDFERVLAFDAVTRYHREASRFPEVKRDLAFVVPSGLSHARVEAEIRGAGGGLIRSVRLFDVYEGDPVPEGRKSLAYALSFQSPERSLQSEEIDRQVGDIVERLRSKCDAVLRDA